MNTVTKNVTLIGVMIKDTAAGFDGLSPPMPALTGGMQQDIKRVELLALLFISGIIGIG